MNDSMMEVPTAQSFPGTGGRTYAGIIDAYHGETGLSVDVPAAAALDIAWRELMMKTQGAEYRDRRLYDKRQPEVLRNLAVDKIFRRLREPGPGLDGVPVHPSEVVVCAYSSTVLLEEAVATIARQDGVLVCPEGYYKSAAAHVAKYGMHLVSSATTPDDGFTIDPEALAQCLKDRARQGDLCGVLLTLPGNPVVADYSVDDLTAIGKVLIEADVPVICDMSFDLLTEGHIPLGAVTVQTANGPVRLYDRILTISGNSKAFNAFGPNKLGAACTGNREWLARIAGRLQVQIQRETTHLARAILEHTTPEYLANNRKVLRRRLTHARELVAGINSRLGTNLLRPLGRCDGMFLTIEFDEVALKEADIDTSSALRDLLRQEAGIDCLALDCTGSSRPGVRFNVVAPRFGPGQETPELVGELFDRVECLLQRIDSGQVRKSEQRARLPKLFEIIEGAPDLDAKPPLQPSNVTPDVLGATEPVRPKSMVSDQNW